MISFNEWTKKETKKMEILRRWRSLSPAAAIAMTPKPADNKDNSLSEDTIRLSGSQNFIESILARLKDLLNFENNQVQLDITYQKSPKSTPMKKSSFVFYCSSRFRSPTFG